MNGRSTTGAREDSKREAGGSAAAAGERRQTKKEKDLSLTRTYTDRHIHIHTQAWVLVGTTPAVDGSKDQSKVGKTSCHSISGSKQSAASLSRLVLCARRVSQRLLTVATDPRHEFACNLRPTMCVCERERVLARIPSLALTPDAPFSRLASLSQVIAGDMK